MGSFYDFEFDSIQLVLECLNCNSEGQGPSEFFHFNDTLNAVVVDAQTPEGIYTVRITLSDDNPLDPKSSSFEFKVTLETLKDEAASDTQLPDYVKNKLEKEGEHQEKLQNPLFAPLAGKAPTFSVSDLNMDGELTISFSQKMRLPQDLSLVDSESLELKSIPDPDN